MKKNFLEKIDSLKKELEKAEKSNNFMYCQKLIQDIIKLYIDNNQKWVNKTEIHNYKEKLKEINLKLPEQLSTFSQTLEIKNETVQKIADFIINTEEIKNIYFNIYRNFEIKCDDIYDSSSKNTPIFLELASMSLIDDEWNSLKIWEDKINYWYYQNYQLYQWYFWWFLSTVFNRLFEQKYFNSDYLIELFQNKFLFSSISSFEKFKVWINKYCEWDFTSSIHILVPLFEEVFLYISNSLWIDTIALGRWKEVSTQTKTLWTEMLNNEIFNITFWKNFIQHIDFILFNELWYKLRHKIAHWNIDFNDCNFHNVSIILFLYFWLWSKVNINYK